MRKLPSAWSIMWTDNACYVVTSIAPAFLFFGLMIKFTGTLPGGRGRPDRPVDPEFANLALASTAALMAFLGAIVAMRVARIRGLFDSGVEVEATVKKVSRFRGGARLKLEFRRAGTTYNVRSTFKRWSKTPVFSEGERISLLVDPANPKRAVPVALYSSTGSPPAGADVGRAPPEHPDAALPSQGSSGLRLGSRAPSRAGDR